tara:strand:+ start:2228 stop:2377 length:150 start_codon:yes stop_codon:yes gene_type:complete
VWSVEVPEEKVHTLKILKFFDLPVIRGMPQLFLESNSESQKVVRWREAA